MIKLNVKFHCDKCKRRKEFEVVEKLEKTTPVIIGREIYQQYYYIVKCIGCGWRWWN